MQAKNGFANQVQNADVIYSRGGATQKLVSELSRDKSWLNHLDSKTLAGTSAGADAIATYYYALDNPRVEQGMGLLPIKVLVHYESDYGNGTIDWRKAYATLDA